MGVGESNSSYSPSPVVASNPLFHVNSSTSPLKVIQQLDGNNSDLSITTNESQVSDVDENNDSDFSDVNIEEVDPAPEPAVFEVSSDGSLVLSGHLSLPDLPLVMAFNARSLVLKRKSLSKLLSEYGPEILLIFETWEHENNTLKELLNKTGYKYLSYN